MRLVIGEDAYRVNLDKGTAGLGAVADFVDVLALPADGDADVAESLLDELADGVGLVGGEDKVIRLVLLEHSPHALNVVSGVTPVTLGVKVTEVQALLLAEADLSDSARDFTGHEGAASARRLVVEEHTVAGVHVIGLAVVLGDPEAVAVTHKRMSITFERNRIILVPTAWQHRKASEGRRESFRSEESQRPCRRARRWRPARM